MNVKGDADWIKLCEITDSLNQTDGMPWKDSLIPPREEYMLETNGERE